jgi:TolB protein
MTKRLALLVLLAGVLVAVPGPHDTARAAFAGKNGRITFVRAAAAGPLEEVFMVSPASGLTANLTDDPATSDTAPAWSPDGTRVAFQRSGPTDGIWTMDATGGDLAFVPHTDHGFQPTWSPDGKRIAFSRFLPGEGNRIFTVAPSGKALTQRTFGGPNDVHPSWSPDGTRIAFARGGDQDDGLPFHIHIVTLASGKTTQMTSAGVQDLLPAWQPQQVSGAPRPPRPGRAGRRA